MTESLFDDVHVTPQPGPAPEPTPAVEDLPAAAPAAPLLQVATDGSCLRNPGPGGWAAAVMVNGRWADTERWAAGAEAATTNNEMELTAIAAVVTAFVDYAGVLEIVTDSRYSIDAVTKWVHGWRKRGWTTASGSPVKNLEIIQLCDAALGQRRRSGLETRFTWVKGHAGHEANEFVDDRARIAAERIRGGGNVPVGPGLHG